MANEINPKTVISSSLAEVGYQGEHYNSKFTKFLDSINWYNYKKAGACTWCCIANDYFVAINKGTLSYEQARQVVCEPANHAYNVGAGAKEKAQLYKSAGRWIGEAKNCTTGDEIFFYKTGTKEIGHVGRVVDWDSKYLYTVEGSTTYNGKPYSFGKKQYSFRDSKIAGFGRPDWYKFQTPDPTPTPSQKTVTVELHVLSLGDKGGEVYTLQILLNEIGFRGKDGKRLTYDMIFGANVEYALKNYQKSRGLEPTGICDYETWNRILK